MISQRYGRRARPAIQEVQQRIAELTANAEENISGVRVVKSFAREPLQLQRFRHSVARVFDQAMVSTRLEASYNPMIGFLPQLGLAAVLLVGGTSVIHAHLSLGQFTAFYFYLNMLISPMRSLGVTLGLAQRATASGARIFQVLDREPRLSVPAGRAAAAARQRARAAAGRDAALRGRDDFGAAYRAGPAETASALGGPRDARGRGSNGRQLQRRPSAIDGAAAKANGRAPAARRRPGGAARRRPRRAGRAHGRARRRDRLGQDEPRLADLAAVRRERGHAC